MLAETERNLVENTRTRFESLLGPPWRVSVAERERLAADDSGYDAVWALRRDSDREPATRLCIQVKYDMSPAAVRHPAIERLAPSSRSRGGTLTLLISRWLSPRTRELLAERGINYADLTGNVSIRLNDPAIIVRTDGAQRDPEPPRQWRRGLTGARAARLVRELVDYEPPRRPRELAQAARLSESYVSRLLEVMTEEALVQRNGSVITGIDWAGLLRARALTSELIKANDVTPTVPRMGWDRVIDTLASGTASRDVLATGSFAASAEVPMTVGGAMMLYVRPEPGAIDDVARDLGLLRTQASTEDGVLLLQPPSEDVFVRPRPGRVRGIPCVGASQLALDCLSGPGRLPSQGDSLIEWMANDESRWRAASPLAAGHAVEAR